jgi:arginine N-succinyltransferase
VRFLFLAMHRDRFRERVLAELMPPLLPDGRSLFWESCGKRFTGLEYQEADKRSRENKEFIQQLFPPGDMYATLFPPRVQRLLGAVGPQTLGAKHLLEKVGFQYADRIDPFDGGPHYEAKVGELTLVRAYRRVRVADGEPGRSDEDKLVAVERPEARVHFRAVRTPARIDGDDVVLPREARELLEVARGDRVHLVPFE